MSAAGVETPAPYEEEYRVSIQFDRMLFLTLRSFHTFGDLLNCSLSVTRRRMQMTSKMLRLDSNVYPYVQSFNIDHLLF